MALLKVLTVLFSVSLGGFLFLDKLEREIVYPFDDTRVAPGDRKPYKAGAGVLYTKFGHTCVPTATNVGLFWPRKGIVKHPGRAVVQILDPIPPGMVQAEIMGRLEAEIEPASDALMREAGFDPDGVR